MDNEKTDQAESFTYHGSIISNNGRRSKGVKSRIAKAQGVFPQFKKKAQKNKKTSLRTKIRLLKAIVMAVVKYYSKTWTL